MKNFFTKNTFEYYINTAFYTNVEKSEGEPEKGFAVAEAAENLAKACNSKNIVLIHISTDYVFDVKKGSPYLEKDKANPLNVYGSSKLKGEKSYIFRTSWSYWQ